MPNPLFEKAQKIQMLLLDVDGVMTDWRVLLLPDGQEVKAFSIHDGFGIVCAMRAGIRVGIISGRSSAALKLRCDELKIEDVYQDTMDKLPVFEKLSAQYGFSDEQIAFIGDDIPDLPVLQRAGLSAAPANAHFRVKQQVDFVLTKRGGDGAVREFIDFLLLAKRK